MENLETIKAFLGWASLLNIGYLVLASILLTVAKGFVIKMHSCLFKVDETQLPILYFDFLARYKIMTIVFFLVPYFSLCLMGA